MITDNLISLAGLERLTKKSYRTLVKRLEAIAPAETNGKEILYDIHQALPAIFTDPVMDLNKERAMLARAQTQKINLEIKKMQQELVDVDVFSDAYNKKMAAFRDKLLNVALKLAGEVSICQDVDANYRTIYTTMCEALDELSNKDKSASEAS